MVCLLVLQDDNHLLAELQVVLADKAALEEEKAAAQVGQQGKTYFSMHLLIVFGLHSCLYMHALSSLVKLILQKWRGRHNIPKRRWTCMGGKAAMHG